MDTRPPRTPPTAAPALLRPPGALVRHDPSASYAFATAAAPRERVADRGGGSTVGHDKGRSPTAAQFPRPAPAQPTTTRKDCR